ncbi:MAG: DUF3596 domain-containing protein [Leptolyngbya sp. SIO3F4]|nr:DUF3596 domain-containing protein [Leptolyngbya sp. SIO3F4]
MPSPLKGTIKIDTDRVWLLYGGYQKQRYSMTLGLTDTVGNRRLAQATSETVKADILVDHFDKSLAHHRGNTTTDMAVVELFAKETAWKRRQISKRSLEKYLGLNSQPKRYSKSHKAWMLKTKHSIFKIGCPTLSPHPH